MATRLRHRERGWLDYVAGLLNDPLTDWPDEQVGRLLNETFGGPASAYYSQLPGRLLVQRQWPPEHFAPYHAEIAHFTVHDAPTRNPILRYYLATGDCRCIMQTVDVPREIVDDRVQAGWIDLARSWSDGIEAQLAVPLLMGPSGHRAFIVGRADPFCAQELRLGGNGSARDAVIELEQAGDSAKAAAEADLGIAAATREAVLDAHLAICILNTKI